MKIRKLLAICCRLEN